jgi:hypothetical protein
VLLLLECSAGSGFGLQLLPCGPLGVCQLQLLLVVQLLLLQEGCQLLVQLHTPATAHNVMVTTHGSACYASLGGLELRCGDTCSYGSKHTRVQVLVEGHQAL